MNSISKNSINEKQIMTSITSFCKEYCVGKALKSANAYKNKGIPVLQIFLYLLQLVYTKKSMYMNLLIGTQQGGFAKDVVYRFLNSPYINWSKFLITIAINVISNKVSPLTSKERINVLILDDTLYSRVRSKCVELLANVHDHSNLGKKFKRGFRQLTLTWSDGCTLIPLLFRHLSSEKEKNRYNGINPKIDKRSCGYKARLQALATAPSVMIEMLKQIVRLGVPAKHILFDCWFAFPATIIAITKLKLDVIARVRKSPKIKYLYNGEKKTVNQIYSSLKKRRGRSKYLLSVIVKLYNTESDLVDARIVYVRDRNNKKNWIAIISTDLNLTEDEIIQLYGRRWDIEVFFKICKSYLNLGKEFKGLSYDTITAHTAVVLVRYMILALEKRQLEDPRSLGEIFFLGYDEVADIQFSEALELILSLLREVLVEALFLTTEQICQLIEAFINKLPKHFKDKMNTSLAS